MKNLTRTWLLLGAASAIVTATANAQIVATFDENGHGVITGAGPAGLPDPYTVPFSTTIADPVSGAVTLSYALPTTVTTGDILLFEPGGGTNNTYSDLVRFVGNRMWFFSERDPGEINPDFADVGLVAPNPNAPVIFLDESGPEGQNGAQWHPSSPADPGYAASVGPAVLYNFQSDVPEPSSLALLGLALGALTVFRRRNGRA